MQGALNTSRLNDSRVNLSEDVTQNIFYNSSFVAQDLASKAAEKREEDFLSNRFESLDYDKIYNLIDFKQDDASKPSKVCDELFKKFRHSFQLFLLLL